MSPRDGFTLEPDRAELTRFVEALFCHAEEGGTVSLRAFFDDALARKRNDPPFKRYAVKINGSGLDRVVETAFKLATEAAQAKRPVVVWSAHRDLHERPGAGGRPPRGPGALG